MSLKQNVAANLVANEFGTAINCCTIDNGYLFLIKKENNLQLIAAVQGECAWEKSWQAENVTKKDGVTLANLKMNANNAALVRRYIKWTCPSACGTMGLSVGIMNFGENISENVINAFKNRQIKPVLGDYTPQILQEKNKNFLQITDTATWNVLTADYRDGYGINAAGLKTEEEIVKALLYGYSMIGLDATDKIVQENVKLNDEEIAKKFEEFPIEFQAAVNASYLNAEFQIGKHKITFTPETLHRIILEYGEVIMHVQYIYNTYLKATPWPIDFELTLHPANRPLTKEEHYLIANELERNGVRIGTFLFDLKDNFSDEELQIHAEIANTFEYRLALANADLCQNDFKSFLKIAKNKCHFKVSGEKATLELLKKL